MQKTALYIHIPWCIRKCPYCDFNSHKSPELLPEKAYIEALIADLKQDLSYLPKRPISSIFIGGGTPSLLSGAAYRELFNHIQELLPFSEDVEITLEANPGTLESDAFDAYLKAGINRLSLGIQSFNPNHLKKLGRIHGSLEAKKAIQGAIDAGFKNINVDLMHSLPQQTVEEAIEDLTEALSFNIQHLSWYQLTLEPNTVFYKQQPPLPDEDTTEVIEQLGFALLQKNGFKRYEISAFSQSSSESRHNLNYWLYGDYYGIGAGAHGKITLDNGEICRTTKYRQPAHYLQVDKLFLADKFIVPKEELAFEFMLNATRLEQPIAYDCFTQTTGMHSSILHPLLLVAEEKGFIHCDATSWQVTPLGRRFTNLLQELFLPIKDT